MKLEEYIKPILERMTPEQRATLRIKIAEYIKLGRNNISFAELNKMIEESKSQESKSKSSTTVRSA